MMVRPELISASSAPSASPLNSWEMKFGQLIMKDVQNPEFADRVARRRIKKDAAASLRLPAASKFSACSSVVAEIAAECVGFLHQALAGDDLDDLVIIFLVLHVLFHLALHDDDRTDALVIFLAVMHIADEGGQRFALFIGLDDIGRVEAARFLDHARS